MTLDLDGSHKAPRVRVGERFTGGWKNLADLIAMSFRDDDEVAMDYLHQLCAYIEQYEAEREVE